MTTSKLAAVPAAEEREQWRYMPEMVTNEGHYLPAAIVCKGIDHDLRTIAEVLPGPKAKEFGLVMSAAPELLEVIEEIEKVLIPGQLPYKTFRKLQAAKARTRAEAPCN